MKPPEDGGVTQIHALTKTAVQRLLQQLGFVNLAKHLRDRVPGNVAGYAERFDVPDNACAAATLHAQLGPRARHGRAPIVDRPFMTKARDGGVDIVWFEFAAREPLAELSFGEFAAGEKRQAGDVRLLCAFGHQCVATNHEPRTTNHHILASPEPGDFRQPAGLRGGRHLVARHLGGC